ncbi:tRNA (cytosine(38)-C(5))-methyltransferase [Cochliomyia hominivorax]
MELRILELFSGIGGMHYAFKYSNLNGQVMAAVDINTVANEVYAFNHKDTCLMNNNIQKLSVKLLEKLKINTILMSPPCQPHTRVGQKRDIEDKRSDALNHICELLPQCKGVEYILMENVKGFEESQARNIYIKALETSNFFYREFILSPTQMGVPNTRHRYYCLARKSKDFNFSNFKLWLELPVKGEYKAIDLSSLLERKDEIAAEFYLEEKVLKRRVWLMDIVTAEATNTMCFTKAYTHYSEGTGSIYCCLTKEEMDKTFAELKELEHLTDVKEKEDKSLILLQRLQLRYFTPKEVARLMNFPDSFNFPNTTTSRQRYRLLGNSINVKVVGELIKLLCL